MALGVLTASAAKEHELSNPEMPSGQSVEERERGGRWAGDSTQEYVLRQSRKLIAGSDWKYGSHFLCECSQIKVSDKAEEERHALQFPGRKCHKRIYLGTAEKQIQELAFKSKFC